MNVHVKRLGLLGLLIEGLGIVKRIADKEAENFEKEITLAFK